MDKAHLGGGLLALDASPRPLGFLNLLSPPTSSPPFHRTRTMEADDVPAVPGNKGRRSIEVDFFSDDKDKKSAAAAANDKKEDLTTINLLPGSNANDDDDDEAATRLRLPNDQDRQNRNTNELSAMQSELARMNDENQRLRGMLTQVTTSYQALQMHLVALMQARADGQPMMPPAVAQTLPVTDAAAVMPSPRQFLGLGPAAAAEETSNSSTEVGSPRPSSSAGRRQDQQQQAAERGDSPDPADPSTTARQLAQQQEASMRKARVSVRARSEAPIMIVGRSPTAASGASTGRRWPRATHAREPTTGAPWPTAAPCGSRFSAAPTTAPSSSLPTRAPTTTRSRPPPWPWPPPPPPPPPCCCPAPCPAGTTSWRGPCCRAPPAWPPSPPPRHSPPSRSTSPTARPVLLLPRDRRRTCRRPRSTAPPTRLRPSSPACTCHRHRHRIILTMLALLPESSRLTRRRT
ncbi:WRKY transcription factor 6 isoform X2 [Zea mays]|uniref:WRKY transcription factor 6 isoform X2 n=1 Tax=Zea mays TaxID=4577 RepID=UPI0009AA3FE9|nr:WRKY transcription factor 6 isoform X2 [Zea mays]|eukprot:XP_020406803.1 WRKY transcription factor 6 isoform X2 [Zea mays]